LPGTDESERRGGRTLIRLRPVRSYTTLWDVTRAEVLLAFFVPAVVYVADAVGTQTETVVICGMFLQLWCGSRRL